MNVSVIIPTLNEHAVLPALLNVLKNEPDILEIIVVDGGSTDQTCRVACNNGARVLRSSKGRGKQLALGASEARGNILWFLHADTIPGAGAATAILTALKESPTAIGGNFRVIFDGQTDFARWLTGFYDWLRSHGIYYGDSAIYVRRTTYDKLGGIRPTALMEDYELTRKMEWAGQTLCLRNPCVITSSRRFKNRKRWRIVLQWLTIHVLYYCNVSDTFLARAYRSEQHVPTQRE